MAPELLPGSVIASTLRRGAVTLIAAAAACLTLSLPAQADIVTGTLTPATAKANIVDSKGAVVAELKPGAYQIQLPVGKYKAQCQAPTQKSQDVLVLSEPVTVNLDCG
jgi:hypothetical protein